MTRGVMPMNISIQAAALASYPMVLTVAAAAAARGAGRRVRRDGAADHLRRPRPAAGRAGRGFGARRTGRPADDAVAGADERAPLLGGGGAEDGRARGLVDLELGDARVLS